MKKCDCILPIRNVSASFGFFLYISMHSSTKCSVHSTALLKRFCAHDSLVSPSDIMWNKSGLNASTYSINASGLMTTLPDCDKIDTEFIWWNDGFETPGSFNVNRLSDVSRPANDAIPLPNAFTASVIVFEFSMTTSMICCSDVILSKISRARYGILAAFWQWKKTTNEWILFETLKCSTTYFGVVHNQRCFHLYRFGFGETAQTSRILRYHFHGKFHFEEIIFVRFLDSNQTDNVWLAMFRCRTCEWMKWNVTHRHIVDLSFTTVMCMCLC